MRFKIWQEAPSKSEKEVYFRLSYSFSDSDVITLECVNERGEHIHLGNVLQISAKGIRLLCGLTSEIGLPRDQDGKVLIYEEYNGRNDIS